MEKLNPVEFRRGFNKGLLKDKFTSFGSNSLFQCPVRLRREKVACKNAHCCKQLLIAQDPCPATDERLAKLIAIVTCTIGSIYEDLQG